MQINIEIPDWIPGKLDKHIDGIYHRSRAHLITIIVDGWIKGKLCDAKRKAQRRGKNNVTFYDLLDNET